MDFLTQLFVIKKYECAGVDGLICKIQVQAVREGKCVTELITLIIGRMFNEFLGIPIVVKEKNNV